MIPTRDDVIKTRHLTEEKFGAALSEACDKALGEILISMVDKVFDPAIDKLKRDTIDTTIGETK